MCKILSLKVNHNNCKDSFKISLDNRKKINLSLTKHMIQLMEL